jgi:hypothetical protein
MRRIAYKHNSATIPRLDVDPFNRPDMGLLIALQGSEILWNRRCQSNGGSSTRRAHALFQMTIYAARARHSANAAERLCL